MRRSNKKTIRLKHTRLRNGLPVTVVKAGSTFYTGQIQVPTEWIFMTRSKKYAKMYADSKEGGRVFRVQLRRDVYLTEKKTAMTAINEKNDPGEWAGFGTSGPDYGVAKSLCRRARQESHRAHGIDGWIHKFDSPLTGELMLCSRDALRVVAKSKSKQHA